MDITIDLTKTVLETERLTLRAFKETDLEDLYEYASVEGVGELAGWKHHENKQETKQILDCFIKEKNILALVYKGTNKVIGSLGLHYSQLNDKEEFKELKIKEIGYVLSKDYWGKGLMPEAVKRVLPYCFDELDFDAVSVGHFKTNNQSRRVIEKCGFKYVESREYYAKALDKTFEDMRYIKFKS